MQQATEEAFAERLAETANAKSEIRCKHCGKDRVYRLFREGYFQEKIYPIFGYYPWECKACGKNMMLRLRRKSKNRALDGARNSGGNR